MIDETQGRVEGISHKHMVTDGLGNQHEFTGTFVNCGLDPAVFHKALADVRRDRELDALESDLHCLVKRLFDFLKKR